MSTKVALIFIIVAAVFGSILKQKQVQVFGGVYSFVKQLKNGQDLKIVLNEVISDGQGNNGFKITFTPGKKKNSEATETPESIAQLIKENYGVEFEPQVFEQVPETLNDSNSESNTIFWLKPIADLDELKEKTKKTQLTYQTGNPADNVPTGVSREVKEALHWGAPPEKLTMSPPERVYRSLSPVGNQGKYLDIEATEVTGISGKVTGWNFNFSVMSFDNGPEITAQDLSNFIKSTCKEVIEPKDLKMTAKCLNTKGNMCAYSTHRAEINEPQADFAQHEEQPAFEETTHFLNQDPEEANFIRMPIVEAYTNEEPVTDRKNHFDEGFAVAEMPRLIEPVQVGRQEFDEADRMAFCIKGLDDKGAFTEQAFDGNLDLAHRKVTSWRKYNEGIQPTCYIEFEFERPDFCAFTSRFEKGEVVYNLRGDSSASCSKFLTGKGYEVEAEPINPIYQFNHQAGKDDLRDDQIEAIQEFFDTCKDQNVFAHDFEFKPQDVKSFSVQYGHRQAIALTLMSGNTECSVEQKKTSPYQVSYVLAEGSDESCNKIVNEESAQNGIFAKHVGNWQKQVSNAVSPIIGELNDNDFFATGVKFAAKEIIYVTEIINETGSNFIIGLIKNDLLCSVGMTIGQDGQANFSLVSGDDKCADFTSKGKKLM